MRLFLALDVPSLLAERLAELQQRSRRDWAGWRWVPAEAIHLTLRFLGDVGAERDLELRESWRQAAASVPRPRFRVRGIGTFPEAGRPRVLWAGVEELEPVGALPALAAAIEQAAQEHGFAAEPRLLKAHVTLARAARSGRASRPAGVAFDGGEPVEPAELVLYQSQLGRTGARYTALASFPLGG